MFPYTEKHGNFLKAHTYTHIDYNPKLKEYLITFQIFKGNDYSCVQMWITGFKQAYKQFRDFSKLATLVTGD